ncbi:MAG: GNAT family N-acetyltransferase [Rhodocyclaceae bacterium]|jgi:ribosomal protein S18 acetylase RimI-like enzyme|nr:GNAT family N-acetyltransferase [Rhodocyclaceae bacterium]
MQPADIGAVLEIQARCYTEVVNESAESFLAKLEVAPEGCFVAQAQGRALGYLVSLPIAFSRPPALDARQLSVPGDVDCLYLHDLAVAPEARGSGAGGVLVRRFMQRARQAGFRRAALIAVQQSGPFWQRQGFRPVVPCASVQRKLGSYGEEACYMAQTLA